MQEVIPPRVPFEGSNPQECLFLAALSVTDAALLLTKHSSLFQREADCCAHCQVTCALQRFLSRLLL